MRRTFEGLTIGSGEHNPPLQSQIVELRELTEGPCLWGQFMLQVFEFQQHDREKLAADEYANLRFY